MTNSLQIVLKYRNLTILKILYLIFGGRLIIWRSDFISRHSIYHILNQLVIYKIKHHVKRGFNLFSTYLWLMANSEIEREIINILGRATFRMSVT